MVHNDFIYFRPHSSSYFPLCLFLLLFLCLLRYTLISSLFFSSSLLFFFSPLFLYFPPSLMIIHFMASSTSSCSGSWNWWQYETHEGRPIPALWPRIPLFNMQENTQVPRWTIHATPQVTGTHCSVFCVCMCCYLCAAGEGRVHVLSSTP